MSLHLSWGGATPSHIYSLGSIQACHLIWGNTSLLFGPSMQHSLAHSLMADRGTVVGHVLTDHIFFYVHSHIDMTAHTPAFLWVGEHSGNLICSYDISHSRTWQVSITSLAATNVSQTVTHPSTNWAQGFLTSVIRPQMVTPYPWGFIVNIELLKSY